MAVGVGDVKRGDLPMRTACRSERKVLRTFVEGRDDSGLAE